MASWPPAEICEIDFSSHPDCEMNDPQVDVDSQLSRNTIVSQDSQWKLSGSFDEALRDHLRDNDIDDAEESSRDFLSFSARSNNGIAASGTPVMEEV